MAVKKACDVGQEIASLLIEWRPKMAPQDIASAIMHGLERYSIDLEGSGESGLSFCMQELEDAIEKRRMSI